MEKTNVKIVKFNLLFILLLLVPICFTSCNESEDGSVTYTCVSPSSEHLKILSQDSIHYYCYNYHDGFISKKKRVDGSEVWAKQYQIAESYTVDKGYGKSEYYDFSGKKPIKIIEGKKSLCVEYEATLGSYMDKYIPLMFYNINDGNFIGQYTLEIPYRYFYGTKLSNGFFFFFVCYDTQDWVLCSSSVLISGDGKLIKNVKLNNFNMLEINDINSDLEINESHIAFSDKKGLYIYDIQKNELVETLKYYDLLTKLTEEKYSREENKPLYRVYIFNYKNGEITLSVETTLYSGQKRNDYVGYNLNTKEIRVY